MKAIVPALFNVVAPLMDLLFAVPRLINELFVSVPPPLITPLFQLIGPDPVKLIVAATGVVMVPAQATCPLTKPDSVPEHVTVLCHSSVAPVDTLYVPPLSWF